MGNLEALRHQIDSAEDMQSIVRIMKTLSAVSIQQYQHAARRLRAYQEVIDRGLHAVMMSDAIRIAATPGGASRAGLIVFGSDQGLCGRFNEIVVERARGWLRQHAPEVPILAIGARCAAKLEAAGFRMWGECAQPGSVSGLSRTAESILLAIDAWRQELQVERVVAIFNSEETIGGGEPLTETILPLDRDALVRIAARAWPSRQVSSFDGDPEAVFSALLRERLYTSLMWAGAESLAAEHATRLSAMQGAERNITDRLEELQGDYRRERQDAITDELMDIVSAYESLSGSGSD